MAKVAKQLTELIGATPILQLCNYEEEHGINANILAKLEYFNPLGSVKDRVAMAMIEDGIKQGNINKDTVIIEPTSGNTGIGLAGVCAAKKLRLILTMPDTMSVERRKIVMALGAEIVLTQGRLGMRGAIAKADELKEKYGNAFIPQQFENPSNPEIHRLTTAKEIIGELADYKYSGVPVINGRGFAVKVNDEASYAAFAEELAQQKDSISSGFFNKWLTFETYRKIVFKDEIWN